MDNIIKAEAAFVHGLPFYILDAEIDINGERATVTGTLAIQEDDGDLSEYGDCVLVTPLTQLTYFETFPLLEPAD